MHNAITDSSDMLQPGESFYSPCGADIFDFANDNGYAYHKNAVWVINQAGETQIRTRCIPARAQLGRVNVSASGSSSGLFEIDDTPYTVGANVPEPEIIRNDAYAHSELNNVLVANSLMASGFGGKPVRLCTGLPLKQYFKEDGEINASLTSKIKKSLKPLAVPCGVADSEHPCIDSHVVFAESLAAFFDWAVDDTGKQVHTVTNGVLVVDVGGGTTDISHVNANMEVYMPGSGTRKIGILDLFKKFADLLCQKHSIDLEHIRHDMLDKAIRTSEFYVRGKMVDCAIELKAAKKHVAKRLKNFVDGLVSDTLDHVIFVGGGAEVLRDELLSLEDHHEGFVIIPKEPQYSNVKGMLKYMTFVMPQKPQMPQEAV